MKESGGQSTKVGEMGRYQRNPGKKVEMAWACDEKKGGLCRKESDGNRRAREGEEMSEDLDSVRAEFREKGLSRKEVYDLAAW